jgi:riboflavin biosynthesis pyrimidine reductase
VYAYPPDGTCVRANMVVSVDGAISVAGRSGGLSGAADRLVFMVLRSLADVIVVGAGTAKAERYGPAKAQWPWLREGRAAAPPIAVVSKMLSLDLDTSLVRSDQTILLTTGQAPPERVEIAAKTAEVVIAGDDEVPPASIISELAGRGYRRMLIEGGPSLLGQFTAAGLLDELCVTTSPLLEGGHAPRMLVAPPTSKAGDPTQLRLTSVLEDDGFLLGRYAKNR